MLLNFKHRYSLFLYFNALFLVLSFLLRIAFACSIYQDFDWSFRAVLSTIGYGLMYDICVISCFSMVFSIYYFLLPNRWINSKFDRLFLGVFYTLNLLILYFTFFAEITFWDEFKSRFNFIAVDYLIYTYEVVKNIQESYPLPLLIGGVVGITLVTLYYAYRRGYFKSTFNSKVGFLPKLGILVANLLICLASLNWLTNEMYTSSNRYNNEIAKAGIFSFFSAFRTNHLNYEEHYASIPIDVAFTEVKNELKDAKTVYNHAYKNPLRRQIIAEHPLEEENKPNVIFVMMESMSAAFMEEKNNGAPITPQLNWLKENSIYFSNMYANGTRTVRGMEAVVLSIPPTPGNSIVKRANNQGLFTIATVFKQKGYHNMFFYGGDGYFDNMNSFFGGNGFDIYDRGRGSILSDQIQTNRYNISDDEVTFENAWGIADNNIYDKVLNVADEQTSKKRPFFAFVMTTSNHKPYTYEEGKIDIPSGSGRNGAVKYADYAIGDFLAKARKKPWFKHTVFVFMADHCANSAGKNAIDIKNHHIPAFIYNLGTQSNQNVEKEVSQIDIFPTLFSALNWNYTSQFYGKDVFDPMYQSRSFVGTYISLGMKKGQDVAILSDQKKINQYQWNKQELKAVLSHPAFQQSIISNYQTADYLFSNHLLNEKDPIRH